MPGQIVFVRPEIARRILCEKFHKNRSLIYGEKIQKFEGQGIWEEVCHYL